MEIKILGTGCAKCKALEKLVKEVLTEKNIVATVEKVEDFQIIVSYGVLVTPGLVVDGKVLSSGKVPTKDVIRQLLIPAL